MSNSGNVLKSSFIKFSNANTRVIDSSALVAKRLEGFTGVLREQDEEPVSDGADAEFNPSLEMLTDENFEGTEFASDGVFTEAPVEEAYEPSPEEIKETILAEARAEADRILEEARESAEALKNSAREEGLAEAREIAEGELAAAKQELEDEANQLRSDYESMVLSAEPRMVEVLTDIYRHVFSDNFYNQREVMITLLNKAMLSVNGVEQIVIYVCPTDYQILVPAKEKICEGMIAKSDIEFVQRDDFVSGQAKLETPFGIIDCSIDTELEELTKALRVLSYESGI